MRMFALLILACTPCYASTGYQLDLYIYSSASGHGLGPETYLAEFRLPAQTPEDCAKIGKLALLYFKSSHLPDGAVTLASYQCEALP